MNFEKSIKQMTYEGCDAWLDVTTPTATSIATSTRNSTLNMLHTLPITVRIKCLRLRICRNITKLISSQGTNAKR